MIMLKWYMDNNGGMYYTNEFPILDDNGKEVAVTKIADRPEPYDDYLFNGTHWYLKPVSVYVPKILTPKQARLALLGAGLYDAVNIAVKSNPAHEIYWEYALEVRRDDTLLIELSTALGITSEQLDDLFIAGSKL